MSTARRDRGSAAIELAILAPVMIVFLIGVLVAGRFGMARQAADAAAYEAARTASLARSASVAYSQGWTAADRSFRAQGITCRKLDIDLNRAGFSVPVGQPATVTVTVTCEAEFSDLVLSGMPGSALLTSTFTSPLDTYRTRSSK